MTISEVPLKPELWVNVFEVLKDSYLATNGNVQVGRLFKVQVKNLCLACRVFLEIAQPFLYEDIEFNGENPDALLENVRRLQGLFHSKPGSSNWIRTLNVVLRNNHQRERINPSLVEAASTISDDLFPRMESLRLIHIQHTVVSKEIYTQLYRLPKLRIIQLWNISFLDDPVTQGMHVEDLTLRTVIFNELHTNENHVKTAAARLAFSPMIETLHLSSSITPTVFKLGRSLGVESLDHLHSLSITEPVGPILEDFYSFARLCPNLKTFQSFSTHTLDTSYDTSIPIHVPEDILPNLTTLHCSPSLAKALVQGRSITDLTCETPTNAGQTISSVQRIVEYTQRLQSLTLRWVKWSEALFQVILSAVPGLESLSLWLTGDEYMAWLTLNLVEAIRPFNKLRQLSCFGKGPTAVDSISSNHLQLQTLTALTESNPALTQVTFNLMFQWNRSPGGIWSQNGVYQRD